MLKYQSETRYEGDAMDNGWVVKRSVCLIARSTIVYSTFRILFIENHVHYVDVTLVSIGSVLFLNKATF